MTNFYHFPLQIPENQTGEENIYHSKDIQDQSNDDFFQTNLNGFVTDSQLAPVLFVIDFDNTLGVYDELYILDSFSTNKLPSTYTRPFLYEFLDYIKSVNINNILILWTAGTNSYIKQNLLLMNIAHYFDKVLSRKHCEDSNQRYGKSKSHAHLVSLFPQYKRMKSIIIDNFAKENGGDTGYSITLSVKPFTLIEIAETYGAFGVPPSLIGDTILFLMSKGNAGTIKKQSSEKSLIQRLGDTTLLNLISYLQENVFDVYKERNFLVESKNDNLLINVQVLNLKNNYFSIAKIQV